MHLVFRTRGKILIPTQQGPWLIGRQVGFALVLGYLFVRCSSETPGLEALFREMQKTSVAQLIVSGRFGPHPRGGVGFLVSKKGYLITARHVIDGAETIEVKWFSRSTTTEARVLREDPKTDLTILKVPPRKDTPLPLSANEVLHVGEKLFVVSPSRIVNVVLLASAQTKRPWDSRSQAHVTIPTSWSLQFRADIGPGDSGAPIVNREGRVVGVTAGGLGSMQGVGFSIPVESVKKLLCGL